MLCICIVVNYLPTIMLLLLEIGDCQYSSRQTAYSKELGTSGSKIARAILVGQAMSIAKAVLEQETSKSLL